MLSEKPKSLLSETRKVTKSTMEKKRRARINSSLTQLKTILSGMVANKGERFDKMEKADILELTVNCVKQLQQQPSTGDQVTSSTSNDPDYTTGMHTCMAEVVKFLSTNTFNSIDLETKTKLLDHLASKLTHSTDSTTTHASDELRVSHCTQTLSRHSPTQYPTQLLNCDIRGSSLSSTQVLCSEKEDSNNNSVDTMSDSNAVISDTDSNMLSPIPVNQVSPTFTTLLTTSQPFHSTSQSQANVSMSNGVHTVPFILVPANLCSSTLGTSYVLPLAIPGQTTPLFQTSPNASLPQQSLESLGLQIPNQTKSPAQNLHPSPRTIHSLRAPSSTTVQESLLLPLKSLPPVKETPATHAPVLNHSRPIIVTSPVTNTPTAERTVTYSEYANSGSAMVPADSCPSLPAGATSSGAEKLSTFTLMQESPGRRHCPKSSNALIIPKTPSVLNTMAQPKQPVQNEQIKLHVQERNCNVRDLSDTHVQSCSSTTPKRYKTVDSQGRDSGVQESYNTVHAQQWNRGVQDQQAREQLGHVQEPHVNQANCRGCDQPPNTVWRPW